MATYSSNVSVKFDTGVTLTGNSSYTVPANSYAILGYFFVSRYDGGGIFSSAEASLTIDGITVVQTSIVNPSEKNFSPVYIPAGKTITTAVTGSKAVSQTVLTIFKNTP